MKNIAIIAACAASVLAVAACNKPAEETAPMASDSAMDATDSGAMNSEAGTPAAGDSTTAPSASAGSSSGAMNSSSGNSASGRSASGRSSSENSASGSMASGSAAPREEKMAPAGSMTVQPANPQVPGGVINSADPSPPAKGYASFGPGDPRH